MAGVQENEAEGFGRSSLRNQPVPSPGHALFNDLIFRSFQLG
jgi:hypothetical protein